MAKFAQYAMVASEEALKDAGWAPMREEDLEATVGRSCICCLPYFDMRIGCLHRIWHWQPRRCIRHSGSV